MEADQKEKKEDKCPECGGNGGVIVGQDPTTGEAIFDRCPVCAPYPCADDLPFMQRGYL